MLGRRNRFCRRFGHWVVVLEHYYNQEDGGIYTHWRCPMCARQLVSKSVEVQSTRKRQSWILTVVLFIVIWGTVLLIERFVR